jgi:osmotically-inducible protein OsmY
MFSAKRFLAAFIAASVLFAAGCGSTASQSSTGEWIDDSTITTKVKTAIFNEATLKVLQINVETYKSVVQLSGFANSNTDIATASKVALSVTGVKSVKNDMRLK